MTDREKLAKLAEMTRDLNRLRAMQSATMAQMIRACVDWIKVDTRSHRLRGHETSAERAAIIAENQKWAAQAPLYLLALATMLENESVRLPDDQPKEITDVHGRDSTP